MSLSEDVDESASDCWRFGGIGCDDLLPEEMQEISSVSEELPMDSESGLINGMRLRL